MLRGEVITDGWESEDVKEALEWCLACKGCRSDCPTHTDMASYKAEFLSHYYERHARPRQAHSMGRIGEWAPLAARAPWLANFLTQTPGLAAIAKRVAGAAAERKLPRLAATPFKKQFERANRRRTADPVLLFADTFNNHFRPGTAVAAVEVLEAVGCAVEVPRERICCGRPYFDFGMLDRARDSLEKLVGALAPRIEAGIPLVVLEPGCLSVFRDELVQLLPGDARAAHVAERAQSLGELLEARGWKPPAVGGRALLHGHCHRKALGGLGAEAGLLRAAGVEVSAPDTGCCGMSGSFGFKPQHYAASRRIAELALLPALRAAGAEFTVIADGFSCREQIEDLAGRETLHFAEVLARALRAR
jgi:hypothetical protein